MTARTHARTRTPGARRPGRGRAQDRGTILLMVVGVLALLAIIGVVYATVGRGDRTAAASAAQARSVSESIDELGTYFQDVIARNMRATVAERVMDGVVVTSTRASTYPATNQAFVSIDPADLTRPATGLAGYTLDGTLASVREQFNPYGISEMVWGPSPDPDPRDQGEPFLATIEPENLRGLTTPVFELARLHDWRHISNISPNGAFVNFANLRPEFGGFNARPGFAPGSMSFGLTLYNRDTGALPASHSTPQIRFDGSTANPAVPSHWDSDQMFAFRPMVDPVGMTNEYLRIRNQWADVDGDGFADSRWTELVDFSQFFGNTEPGAIISGMKPGDRYRLFVAARIIDNGAMVNVNTAGDAWAPPSPPGPGDAQAQAWLKASGADARSMVAVNRDEAFPIGLTPADIDLARLLDVGEYTYDVLGLARGDAESAYGGVGQPAANLTLPVDANFSTYIGTRSLPIATRAAAGLYEAKRRGAALSRSPAITRDPATGSPVALNNAVGSAYSSPKLRFYEYAAFAPGAPAGMTSAFSAASGGNVQISFNSTFNMTDELELRTFWGVNDPVTQSRLESAAAGRLQGSPLLSPLRDARGFETETKNRAELQAAALFAGTGTARETLLSAFTDVRRFITSVNGARPLLDGGELSADVSTDLAVLRGVDRPNTNPPWSRDAAAQRLYATYLGALAPFVTLSRTPDGAGDTAWSTNRMPTGSHWGLYYGGRPEFALRTAAAMVANLMASIERTPNFNTADTLQPAALTLQLCDSSQVGGSNSDFPWPKLALRDEYLATSPHELVMNQGTGRVNVYGVKAQPFLIGVGTYALFVDVAHDASHVVYDPGDNDGQITDPSALPGTETYEPITIKFQAALTNADFIGEVLAFQVHNPFEEPVRLSDDTKAHFYVEFARRYYALADQSKTAWTYSGVTLQPGETRTFIALNPGRYDMMEARLKNAYKYEEVVNSGGNGDGKLDAFFDNQFGAGRWTVIPAVYPGSFKAVGSNPAMASATPAQFTPPGGQPMQQPIDLFGEDSVPALSGSTHDGQMLSISSTKDERKVVHLWRTMVAPGESATDNDPDNDLLADRLRLPKDAADGDVLFSKVHVDPMGANGSSKINGTMGGPEGDPMQRHDNKGFSALLWAFVARPTDSASNQKSGYLVSSGGTQERRGVLPPWCMEVKPNDPGWATPGASTCLNHFDNGKDDMTESGDYPSRQSATSLADMIGKSAPNPWADKIARERGAHNNSEIGTRPGTGAAGDPYIATAVEFHSVGDDNNGSGVYVSRNAAMYSRPGDFLLPLAIAPTYDPQGQYASPYANVAGYTDMYITGLEHGWITLSEAIAAASGYYRPAKVTDDLHNAMAGRDPTSAGNRDAFVRIWQDANSTPLDFPKTDRGHLRLDAFVPFATIGANTQPVGAGIPMGLSVIDRFRCAFGVASSLVTTTPVPTLAAQPQGLSSGVAFGGATTLIPGKINLNTATPRVSRLVPLFAPARPETTMSYDPWLANPQTLPSVTPALPGASTPGAVRAVFDLTDPAAADWDVAAAVAAYRDKSTDAAARTPPGGGTHAVLPDFAPGRAVAINAFAPTAKPREGRGLRSVGEVGLVNFRDPTTATLGPWGAGGTGFRGHSVFRLADPLPAAADINKDTPTLLAYEPGIVSSRFYPRDDKGKAIGALTTPAAHRPLLGGSVPDGYQDKLAILNAAANTVSVRSDVFTVYFQVAGFTPEDCQVEPGEPLIPSLSRRYVMVVDRSNVTPTNGAKPRVLMLKELPQAN